MLHDDKSTSTPLTMESKVRLVPYYHTKTRCLFLYQHLQIPHIMIMANDQNIYSESITIHLTAETLGVSY